MSNFSIKNDIIRLLAEQSATYYNGGLGTEIEVFDKEKFAQLIVQECLKIVEPDMTSGDEWCVTLNETAQSIRQHFGVE
jgi:hypothetical protein